MTAPLRSIPSVDKVLRDLGDTDLPRPAVVAVARRELAAVRSQGMTSEGLPADAGAILARVRGAVDDLDRARLRPVINGTGIIIHTNFGRSPLGPRVVEALADVASNYNNLEFDLTGGSRGGRAAYLEHNLAVLCGAEAATVVNNCAAALVLMLHHFCRPERSEVAISRGELVQIGGGFRVPEILEAGGATLREVGTTNKTTADDYARAVGAKTAMVLKVHRSNFYMGGFVESPTTEQVAAVARAQGVPFVEDLGSGAMTATEDIGPGAGAGADASAGAGAGSADRDEEGAAAPAAVEHEPTPAESLRQGADLVCFSGDKLLGGPQAGVIAGAAGHVAALKKQPLFRALRCDKLILSALQTTVDLHLRGAASGADAAGVIPIYEMMRLSNDALRGRAGALVEALAASPGPGFHASVGRGESRVGGGTLPRTVIPSVTLDLQPVSMKLEALADRLRAVRPPLLPVIGYVSGGRFKLDLRTIFPRQDEGILAALRTVLDGQMD